MQDDFQLSQLSEFLSSSNIFDDSYFAGMQNPQSNQQNVNSAMASSISSSGAVSPSFNASTNGSPKESPQTNAKRKLFSEIEDNFLTYAALKYNQKAWKKVAQFVPGRTPKQCRDRWVNYLKPSLKFDPWTDEEDQLLVSLVNTYGTHWTKMIESFPNRSTNSLKNRWYWLIKNDVKSVTIDNSMEIDKETTSQNILQGLSQNNMEKKLFSNLNQKLDDINTNLNDESENNGQQKDPFQQQLRAFVSP